MPNRGCSPSHRAYTGLRDTASVYAARVAPVTVRAVASAAGECGCQPTRWRQLSGAPASGRVTTPGVGGNVARHRPIARPTCTRWTTDAVSVSNTDTGAKLPPGHRPR